MPDRQNQRDVFGRQPTVFRDVIVLAARKHELPPTFVGHPTQQRVVRENLECRSHARELRQRPPGIDFGSEIGSDEATSQRRLSRSPERPTSARVPLRLFSRRLRVRRRCRRRDRGLRRRRAFLARRHQVRFHGIQCQPWIVLERECEVGIAEVRVDRHNL